MKVELSQPNLVTQLITMVNIEKEKLLLELGQVLTGQVLEKGNNFLKLRLNGVELQARSELNLKPGDKIAVVVKGIEPGRVILQLTPEQPPAGVLTDDDLRRLLRSLNLRSDQQTLLTVKKLMQNNLTLNRENIEYVHKHLFQNLDPNKSQVASEQEIDFLVFTLKKGLMPNGEAGRTLRRFFTTPSQLAEQVKQLQTLIENWVEMINFSQPALIAEGTESLIAEKEYAVQTSLVAKKFLDSESLLLAEKILNALKNMVVNPFLVLHDPARLRQVLHNLQLDFPQHIDVWFNELQDLYRNLTQTDAAKQVAVVKQILDCLEEIKANITAQRYLNFPDVNSAVSQEYLYMQLPLQIGEKMFTGEIRISYPKKANSQASINPEHLIIFFALETQNLGILGIELRIKEKQMECTIEVEDEKKKAFVERYIQQLKSRLGEFYQIHKLACYTSKGEIHRVLPLRQMLTGIPAGKIDLSI